MKDGFRLCEVEPIHDTLDFMGPPRSSDTVKLLEGNVKISLSRPMKIKSMAVKFKGFGKVNIKGKFSHIDIVTPMLPKLKCSILGKTNLQSGDHLIPWDLEIPNIYPPTLNIKRSSIYYRIEVVITFFALSKSITIEHPITLRRHLLPCMEFAPMVETKLYEHTVPAKFHYEIEAPQIICLDQQFLPFAVKYLCIANQKAVQSIRTQLTQIELYRVNSISKADSDLTQIPIDIFHLESKVIQCKDRRDYAKFVKRTIPAFIHSVDQTRSSAWKQPIVLRHKLHPFLQCSYDSPLVTIHHQLEITFQFDHRFEDIKAKIPIIIASIPTLSSSSNENKKNNSLPLIFSEQWLTHLNGNSNNNNQSIDTKYPFETITRFESMNVIPEVNDRSVPRTSEDSTARYAISSVLIDPNATQLDFHSNNHLLPSITSLRKQQDKQEKDHQRNDYKNRSKVEEKNEKEDHKIEKDIPIWKSALPPPPTLSHQQNNNNKNKKSTHPRNNNIMNPPLNGYHYYQQKHHHHPEIYNRCTSALDFNTYEQQQQYQQRLQQQQQQQQQLLLPDERPRTTTPLQRRQDKMGNRRRRKLPPIDVKLANGLKPKIKIVVDPSCQKTDKSSEVLPESDRDILSTHSNQQQQQQQQQNKNESMEIDDNDDYIYDDQDIENDLGGIEGDDLDMDMNHDLEIDDEDDPLESDPFDFQSVYSDLSLGSHGAPSLSSSATEASIGSHHTLLTRPPSPAFRPAPGLPANIALRSHDDERPTALVEESFDYAAITSPAIATVASSVILSPCQSSSTSTTTSSNHKRRIALSSVSSIMNSVASGHSGSQHFNHDALSFRSFGGPFNNNGTATTISSFHTAPTNQPSSSSSSSFIQQQQMNTSSNNSIIPNDSHQHHSHRHSKFLLTPHGSIRDSIAVDPDNMDLIQQSNQSPNSINTSEAKQHYLHAKLPPIPTHSFQQKQKQENDNENNNNNNNSSSPLPNNYSTTENNNNGVIPRRRKNQNQNNNENENTTKRMTRLYTDDSDDETLDPLPPIPEKHMIHNTSTLITHPSSSSTTTTTTNNSNNKNNTPIILSSGPPQLPRLSFGIALGDALGLDQFKKKL
ncbi:unnamed protein product [Cunninghamella blakesleeana]